MKREGSKQIELEKQIKELELKIKENKQIIEAKDIFQALIVESKSIGLLKCQIL